MTQQFRITVRVGRKPALDRRPVTLVHLPVLELRLQAPVRRIVLGDHEQPGRVAVEPVNDTGPQVSGGAREAGEMVQERVHQGAAGTAGAGMHVHARSLVDHREMVVFVDDGNVDRLGRGPQRRSFHGVDLQDLATPQPPRCLALRLAVDMHPPRADPFLDL